MSAASQCTAQIEMTLSCRNLINMDVLSKSDPFCVVYTKDAWQDRFFELGRTETIMDCLNPEWVRKFVLDYNFETVQRIRFEVWDLDPNGKDFLGSHETTLAEIVSMASQQYVRKLGGQAPGDTKYRGEIVVVTEELSSCKMSVSMKFGAEHLPKSFFGLFRPSPFLVLSRSNEGGSYSVVAKSETVFRSKEPTWPVMNLSVRTLCNGDFDRAIKIDCYNYSSSGSHSLIGTCYTSLSELVGPEASAIAAGEMPKNAVKSSQISHSSTPKRFTLARTKVGQAKVTATSPSRTLVLREITLNEEISFLDYIKSGTQMHFAVAIDFTASNGSPADPCSLHYLEPFGNKQNPYETALHAVGEIISQYDSTGMYPAFGFGAKLPPHGHVSHQFPLNSNQAHPYCTNMNEIVTHYRNCLATVTLHGPTNFSPVIRNTAQIASQFFDGKHYFVLLIITDGIISDMYHTKRALIDASSLPISVIIVGVGNADFTAMDELDSDDALLEVDGRKAQRDIVQFVPFNKFVSSGLPGVVRSKADLAREVLAEIPDQMTGYMKSKGFLPTTAPA